MRKLWEYRVIDLYISAPGLEAKLNDLGLSGWELVSVTHPATTVAGYEYPCSRITLKRYSVA